MLLNTRQSKGRTRPENSVGHQEERQERNQTLGSAPLFPIPYHEFAIPIHHPFSSFKPRPEFLRNGLQSLEWGGQQPSLLWAPPSDSTCWQHWGVQAHTPLYQASLWTSRRLGTRPPHHSIAKEGSLSGETLSCLSTLGQHCFHCWRHTFVKNLEQK